MKITARANSNIALVKYWGKLDEAKNLPATGSLSLTLDCFTTTTTLIPIEARQDMLVLNGRAAEGKAAERVRNFLDLFRARAEKPIHFEVVSTNNFPTASGLASSASGFAALAMAANQAFGLDYSAEGLSQIARMGSGSAARSIFDGFALMRAARDFNDDVFASQVHAHADLDVKMIVIRCAENEKAISSTKGMLHCANTSPFYKSWVQDHATDLDRALGALKSNDFATLGEISEHSTLKMHATMLASSPGFWYFAPLTIQLMNKVRMLRNEGAQCYFTMDAGPHVKVLCRAREANALAEIFRAEAGVLDVCIASPGPGARLVSEEVR